VTQPGPGEPVVGEGQGASPPAGEEHPVIAWTRAILGGIRDTARQALDEGRRGAQEAYDEGWRRYDDKTRYRRTRRPERGD